MAPVRKPEPAEPRTMSGIPLKSVYTADDVTGAPEEKK